MLTRLLTTSAIVLAMSGAAFAQTSTPTPSAAPSAQGSDSKATPAPGTPTTDQSGASTADKPAAGGSDVKSSASPPVSTGSDNKSTDVKSAPPVAGTSTTSGSTAASGSDKTAAKDEPAAEKMDSSHVRASKWIGKGVEGSDGKDIGKVADLILDKDGKVQKVVVSVGGFLGIGDKHVALSSDQVKLGADDKLTTSMSQEQLKSHPRFEYAEDRPATSRTGSGTSVPPASPAARTGGATGSTAPSK